MSLNYLMTFVVYSGKRPELFKDVNLLHTGLQHDVDHGVASKVKAKKKNIAQTFKKYSGSSSPQTLAPEQFPVVQANLLAKLRPDLENLNWSTSGVTS